MKIIKITVLFSTVLFLMCIFVFAAQPKNESHNLYALPEANLPKSAHDDLFTIDNLTTPTTWSSRDKSSKITFGPDSSPRIILTPSDDVLSYAAAVSFKAARPLDLTEYREISVFLNINSEESHHRVILSVISDGKEYEFTAVISSNESYALYASLEGIDKASITSVGVRIIDENSLSSHVEITRLAADKNSYAENADLLSVIGFDIISGGLAASNNSLTLISGSKSAAECEGITAWNDYSRSGNVTGFSIDVSVNEYASLIFYVDIGGIYKSLGTINVTPSQKHYYFPSDITYPDKIKLKVNFESENGEAAIGNISLSCENLVLEEMSYSPLANITKFGYDEKSNCLEISGTVSSTNVIKHINSSIAVYTFRISENSLSFEDKTPLAKTRISTKFDIKINRDDLPYDFSIYRYVLTFVNGDEIIPVSAAEFPDLPAGDPSIIGSNLGMHSVEAADAFEANASNVIIDVSVTKLTGGSELYKSGVLVTRGNKFYYFNKNYISELKHEYELLEALGISVYYRLMIDEDMSSEQSGYLTQGTSDNATYYSVNIENENGENLFTAIVEYLASSFPNLKGFILGSSVDDQNLNARPSEATASEYAKVHAKSLAILYKTAVLYARDISVFTSISVNSRETHTLLAMISHALSYYGEIPWAVMIESDIYSKDVAEFAVSVAEQLLLHKKKPPMHVTMLWTPGKSANTEIVSVYEEICSYDSSKLVSAYFLSLEGISAPGNLYSDLKKIMSDDADRVIEYFNADLIPVPCTGSFLLWDFRNEYSTLGWLSGGGCSSLNSQRSSDGRRCLSASMTMQSSGSFNGFILCMTANKYTLADAPIIAVELALSGVDGTADLLLTFGGGDSRSEYSIKLGNTKKSTVYCDLSEYKYRADIDYITVKMSGTGEDVHLDIFSVTAASNVLTDDELADKIPVAEGENFNPQLQSDSSTKVITFIILTILISAITFAILSKIAPEDKNKKQNKNGKKVS